ncbi:hypothetical protein FHX81_2411 [Saccharothrix saharensis]|uniref:Uncharacterized protein n=1 Tax=Saccharothrix saharensis TaxID=571190 RepID=A0A543JB68_9PSEU|nr:hypothetical protein FHX81_2411 [Saccharothrix saharensis]
MGSKYLRSHEVPRRRGGTRWLLRSRQLPKPTWAAAAAAPAAPAQVAGVAPAANPPIRQSGTTPAPAAPASRGSGPPPPPTAPRLRRTLPAPPSAAVGGPQSGCDQGARDQPHTRQSHAGDRMPAAARRRPCPGSHLAIAMAPRRRQLAPAAAARPVAATLPSANRPASRPLPVVPAMPFRFARLRESADPPGRGLAPARLWIRRTGVVSAGPLVFNRGLVTVFPYIVGSGSPDRVWRRRRVGRRSFASSA